MQQSYVLTIWDLFTMNANNVCGGEVLIAIMDGDQEVDRFTINGKCQAPNGYRRKYTGKAGLVAQLLSGPAGISYVWDKDDSDPYKPAIAWRRLLRNPPDRKPAESDVHDGRAEYVLSGPYSLGEGARIEVINGLLLWSGSSVRRYSGA